MLRSPLNRLGPSVDEVKRTVSPEFSQGRRNFGKGAAITGAALGTGVGVSKLAKHADEMLHGTKAVKAAPTPAPVPSSRWDGVVDEIYQADEWNRLYEPTVRPPESKFLRDKGNHQGTMLDPLGEIETFDLEYASRKMMGEENYARMIELDDLTWHRRLTPDESHELNRLVDTYLEKITNPHSHNYERSLMSSKNRAQYDELEQRLDKEPPDEYEYVDNPDSFDGSGGHMEHIPNSEADRLMGEMRQVMRDDLNVSRYRHERAKARASRMGDDLWDWKRKELEDEFTYQIDTLYDASGYGSPDMSQVIEAERALKQHLDLGERVGLEAYPPKRVSQKSSVHFNVPSNTSNLNISAKGFLDRGKAALQHVIKHLKPEIAEKIPVEQIEKAIEAAPKPKPKPLAPDQQFAEQLGAPNNFLSPPRAQRVKIKNDRAPRKGTRGLHNDMEHGAWPRDMGSLRDVIEDVQATGKLPQELPDEVVEAIRRADFGYDELDLYDMTHVYVPKNPLKKRVMDRVENREILGRYEEFNPPSPDDNYRELKF